MQHINVAELLVMCSSLSLAEPMPYTGICGEAALADQVMTSVAQVPKKLKGKTDRGQPVGY